MEDQGEGSDADAKSQLVERYLDQQGRELAIRAHELEIEKQKDDHNFEFSKAALAAQAEDRKHDRNCKIEEVRHRHRLVIYLALIISAMVSGAIWMGQPAVALEIAKCIGLLLAGGIGGYGYAKSRNKPPSDEQT